MARNNQQNETPKFAAVSIVASANGFTVTGVRVPAEEVPAPRAPQQYGQSPAVLYVANVAANVETYTFEKFASMSAWLSKNVKNGGA